MKPYVYHRYRSAFAEAIAARLGASPQDVSAQVQEAEPVHGDLSFPTFSLAKSQKKPPAAIAASLAQGVSVPGLQIQAQGPYLNARFLPVPFSQEVLEQARSLGTSFGSGESQRGKTVVIDYSSPNIAKPIAFHHIRSTVIGHCLSNLYATQGATVEGINYLGDWGKQFGLVAAGFSEYGDPARRREMAHLVDVYVRANARAEKDPAFDEQARRFFRRMEQKDPEALRLWKELRETSLDDFKKIYQRLGIEFTHYEGESRYQDRMDAVIDEIGRTVGVRESEGALIVEMDYGENEPPVLLRKNDGSTLYATRDLAAAIDRYERFHFDRALYVVSTDQSLYFRQLFRVLERMGKPWAKDLVHVGFGRVHGMSTRKGQIVLLDDVLNEAKNLALEKVLENQSAGKIQTDQPELLAEQVAIGAVVFGDLKNRRLTDYTFNWEEILSFEGHTGPYLQYAHARASNILLKGGGAPSQFNAALLVLPEEQALARSVARLPLAVEEALEHDEPSTLARYLLELGAAFSHWYTAGNQDREKRALVSDPPLRDARLALTDSARIALASGLKLLGIPIPERM